MSLSCTGVAIIQHTETGVQYTILASELDWEETEDGDERAMGPEIHHTAVVEHPELGPLEWYVAEYPLGAFNDRETNVGPHTLLRDFNISIDTGEDDDPRVSEADMVAWFFANYEDPAVRTPYESAEGGYQWIWGGPFEALDVLIEQFPDASYDVIERAVKRIEAQGITEWAPVEQDGDYDPVDDDGPERLPELSDLLSTAPAQSPGLMFAMKADGRFGVSQPSASDAASLSALQDVIAELREVAKTLADLLAGSNAHKDLAAVAKRYSDVADKDPISIAGLYAVGVRLENARAYMAVAVSDGTLPELPSAAAECLDSLLKLHAIVIAGTSEGQALIDHSRNYALSANEIATLRRATSQLHEAVLQDGDLLTDDAGAALAEAVSEIGAGPHPERSTELAANASKNLLIVIAKGALVGAGIAAGQVLGTGFGASIPGGMATDLVTQACNGAWDFFLKHAHLIRELAAVLGPEGSWIRAVSDTLRHLRK